MHAIDVILDAARRGFDGNVQLSSHFSTSVKAPGLGATAMMVLMRSMGRNLIGEFFSESEMDLTMFSSSLAISEGRPFFTLKDMHALVGELIAVEHGHQVHQAAHISRLSRIRRRLAGA